MSDITGQDTSEEKFARRLGLAGATNLGLGAMLGGGIYVISGIAAGMVGPGIIVAYLFTGLLTVFTAINYAELSSSIPKQGGGYTFAHDTFGGFPAFLTGWFLLVGNVVACGLYSLAVAHTLALFIPSATPEMVTTIAVVIIAFTLVTNILSVKGVSGVLGVFNIAQSIVLFSFIGLGLLFVQPANLDPFFAPGTGFMELMATVSFIYISFIGYELITTASEEIKEPAKNIPRAILLTLLIATAIYVTAAFVMVGVVPYSEIANLESPVPVAYVYGSMLGTGAFYFGLAGMAASNYAALNATFLSTARVTYALGRDRFLPGFLERVSPRFKTPIPALLVGFIAVSAFALTGRVDLVASLAGLAYLVGQTIVNSSVIVMRIRRLNVPGTFRAKFFPAFPILGVAICLLFIVSQSFEAMQMGFWLALIGLVIYLSYGRRQSTKRLQESRTERIAASVFVFELNLNSDSSVGIYTPITDGETPMIENLSQSDDNKKEN
ncbi:MAG: APC family permease [Candidatus Thorarchaeota archaeon]|jgi:amino acid transporter